MKNARMIDPLDQTKNYVDLKQSQYWIIGMVYPETKG